MHALDAAGSTPSSQGLHGRDRAVHLQVGRVLPGAARPLPPPKDVPLSASSAPIAIATGSALGYPRCRLPHPAATLPAALATGPRALPVWLSQAHVAQRGVWGALALGSGCLQHRASFPAQGPAQAHPRGLGGPRQLCRLLSHQNIMSAETSSR